MGDDVRARRVEPEKERLAVALGLVNKLERQVENFVVHRLRSSACRSCPSAAVRSDRLYRDRTPSSPRRAGASSRPDRVRKTRPSRSTWRSCVANALAGGPCEPPTVKVIPVTDRRLCSPPLPRPSVSPSPL